MDGLLKVGVRVASESGNQYKVVRLLGSGGQGEVYEVSSQGGNRYALKWYFENMAGQTQYDIVHNLFVKGAPDNRFLWPTDIIKQGKTFGYIMPLRPSNYKSIVDLMKRRAEPSSTALCRAGYNLADAFQKLHSMGYCYRDVSFGNVFLNPDNGDILICDNDNVSVNGESNSGVLGTPRFMAPEIVRGEKPPSTDTDLFSMAVLLFYIFMLHHPLEGKKEANIKCFDTVAMNEIYGTHPVFIWDPNNTSNRPVSGYQQNAIDFWNLYPQFLKELFTVAFTEGLNNCNKRIIENQWKETFIKLNDSILYCNKCGAENFYDIEKLKTNQEHICWYCKSTIAIPPRIKIGKNQIVLNKNTKIYKHHLFLDYDFKTIVGEVSQHPQDPSRWGIRNLMDTNWSFTKPDGTIVSVEKGKNVPLFNGMCINFGTATGDLKI